MNHPSSWGPPAPPRRGVPVFVWILASAVALGAIGTCGTCAYLGMRGATEPSGVIYASQVPQASKDKIASFGLLEPGEELLVYYDGSVSLDMSQLALITSDRVMSVTSAARAGLRLAEIVSIDHRTEALIGDVIEVATGAGQRLRIEIAPFNDGTTFLSALEDEVRKRNADVVVRRAPER